MKPTRKLLFGKTLLLAFLATIAVISLLVYLTGLSSHRSVLDNAVISLTVLAICFFVFLTICLFNGLNVLDNYSHKLQIRWRKATKNLPEGGWIGDAATGSSSMELPDVGDGLEGVIAGILLWILFTIVMVLLLFVFQAVLWLFVVLFTIVIYWVFIRSLKLIFSKSPQCHNDLPKSVFYALGYTSLYVGWIYGILYVTTLF